MRNWAISLNVIKQIIYSTKRNIAIGDSGLPGHHPHSVDQESWVCSLSENKCFPMGQIKHRYCRPNRPKKYTQNHVALVCHAQTTCQGFSVHAYRFHTGIVKITFRLIAQFRTNPYSHPFTGILFRIIFSILCNSCVN